MARNHIFTIEPGSTNHYNNNNNSNHEDGMVTQISRFASRLEGGARGLKTSTYWADTKFFQFSRLIETNSFQTETETAWDQTLCLCCREKKIEGLQSTVEDLENKLMTIQAKCLNRYEGRADVWVIYFIASSTTSCKKSSPSSDPENERIDVSSNKSSCVSLTGHYNPVEQQRWRIATNNSVLICCFPVPPPQGGKSLCVFAPHSIWSPLCVRTLTSVTGHTLWAELDTLDRNCDSDMFSLSEFVLLIFMDALRVFM